MSNYPPNRGRGRGRGGATENGAGNFLNGRGRGRGRGYVQGDFGRGRGRGGGGDRGGHGGRGGRGGRGGLSAEDRNQIMIARREETLQVATTEGTDDVICAASAPNEQFQKLALSVLYRDEFEFHDCWSVRRFINSCLVNLSNHHSIDVSQLIPALAAPSGITRLSGLMLMPMITDGGNGGYTNTDKLSFQYDVLPLVGVLTREKICMATLSTESNAIYNAVYNNRIWFFELGIIPCFSRLIANGSIEDKYVSADEMSRENSYACTIKSLQRALLAVVRLVFQLVKRIREARLEMAPIVEALVRHAKDSRNLATSSPTEHYLSDIVYRELGRLERMTSDVNETSVSSLQIKERARPPPKKTIFYNYDPPGELSVNGIRHGNDKVDFSEISILPRIDEITCQRTPFLPANGIPEAPHYLEPGWRRQLDIHFRLYREDLIDSLRKGILGFMELLDKTAPFLEKNLLKPKELRKSLPKGLFMKLYKVTEILQVDVHRNEGTGILISFEQPAQIKNSTPKERKEFWERNKNRLASGGLVSLIRRANLANRQHNGEPTMEEKFEMHLAIVMGKDNELLAKNDKVAKIRITSSDSGLFSLLFESDTNHNPWYLVESSGGFYEAFKPILMALQKAEPATLPFGRYLAPTKQEIQMNAMEPGHIAPPIYATAPGFRFDLSVLLKGKKAKLDVRDAGSIKDAVSVLQTHSTLDSTQAEALVETLCREVALISGPPGTGKTKIGVDLMQVLLHNRDKMRCGPIVCICYTNHALDQFLEHLLDIGEKNIVRIGARSKSERLDPYTLQNRKQLNPHNVRKTVAMASEAIEIAQEKILRLGQDIKGELPWKRIRDHISLYRPELLSELQNGPPKEKVPPRDKKATPWKVMSEGELYHEWISCTDIKERVDANQNIGVRLKALGFGVLDMDKPLAQYTIPKTNRVVGHLRNDIWEMSEKERGRLLRAWKPEIYRSMQRKLNQHIQEVNRAIAAKRAAYDDASRQVLQNSSVIGMTTNGAAKMNELISSISPKIIICEEAGEVLESHILSALSPSTQHLILIGDHLQLRPQIENYELSMDSKSGKLYKLDQSLFERLVTAEENPLPMSKLTIQRRMRPEISSLIRTALYPHLADGDKVREYPPVTGMRDSLYFMDHDHPEDGKDQDGSSYSNKFEVQMIEALAFYLIKNGYDKEGDIAVLTPYLGQLSKLRDGLGKSFAIMLDERDQDLLDKKDEQELKLDEGSLSANGGVKTDVNVKKVSLQRHLTLRTIDNYQGEEAKIVIISLVRNRTDGLASSIGFLRSPNRTNVLLSRAQHGMFLLGNASLMESKKEFGIWPTVINELRENDRIGEGFRLRCKNHPDIENVVVQPSSLKQCAPNGGCIRPCGYNMECGHVCPLQCHPDDERHLIVRCYQPCTRLLPVCFHACLKECGQNCGDCLEVVEPFMLACYHILEKPFCWQKKNPSRVLCRKVVPKELPRCEHIRDMPCHQDPKDVKCKIACGVILDGCGHPCKRQCGACQDYKLRLDPESKVEGKVARTEHQACQVKCGKSLMCGHSCESTCHFGALCPPCTKPCAVACAHFKCQNKCEIVCAPCCAPCVWECPHNGRCEMPCGVPCDRLPCNKRCETILSCGHQCPSVCGEPCADSSFCQECKNPQKMGLVVDLIMQETLANVDLNDDPILVLSCGHALTMSTLDGMMEINQFYEEEMDPKTGASSFVSKLPLPGSHPLQMGCPHCRKPIMDPLRYGRRIKYAQLAMRLKKHQISQSTAVSSAQKELEEGQLKLTADKTTFLKMLRGVKAGEKNEPPSEKSRKIGRLSQETDQLPELNLFAAMSTYSIPTDQAEKWKAISLGLRRVLVQFRNIHEQAMNSPTRKLFESAVSHLYRSKVLKIEAQQLEDKNLQSSLQDETPASMDGMSSANADVASPEPSSSTATAELVPEYKIEPERITGVDASRIIQECIRECGLPVDGYGGASHLDALQGIVDVLLILVKVVFEILSEDNQGTGWYWYQEDILKATTMVTVMYIEVAQRGNFRLRELTGLVHVMGLIVSQAKLRNLREQDHGDREQKIKDVKDLESQFEVKFRSFVSVYSNVKTPTEEAKLIRQQCHSRAMALELDIKSYVKASRGGTFYTSVSDNEKMEIFKIMSASLRGNGHWYMCPNGHTYVIGECGMAMQESQCPECGARIGGGSHELLQTNSVSTAFESLYL